MTDRRSAKAGMKNPEGFDPELEAAKGQARSLQSELAAHQHAQKMRDKELGLVGQVFGGEKNAPTSVAAVAFLTTIAAFALAHVCIAIGVVDATNAERLSSAADKCLAISTLALGYVCGKAK